MSVPSHSLAGTMNRFLLLAWLATTHALADEQQDFLDQAPRGWAELLSHRRGQPCDFEFYSIEGGEETFIWSAECRSKGDLTLLRIHDSHRELQEIRATNYRYSFEIAPVAGVEGKYSIIGVTDPWAKRTMATARTLLEADTEPRFSEEFHFLNVDEYGFACLGFLVPLSAIPWHDANQVQLRDVSWGSGKESGLVTIVATFSLAERLPVANGSVVRADHLKSATITFDSERLWIPIRAKGVTMMEGEESATETIEWTYDDNAVPRIRKSRRRSGIGQRSAEFRIEFKYPDESVTAEEFTLPYYGLPEPPQYQSNGRRWWIAGGLVIVAIGLFLLRRRSK